MREIGQHKISIAILAGGLATRLRPLTERIPKSLLEIAGRPFIFYQLEWLREQGFEHVVLCVGFLGEQIQAVVGNGSALGLKIEYSFDGEQLLGTGGAIRQALPLFGESFFVLYGDSYLSCKLSEIYLEYKKSKKPALMTVLNNRNLWGDSNVLFENKRIVEYNKHAPKFEMMHIDYGLGIFSSEVFDRYVKNQFFDLADVYQKLSLDGKLAGFEVSERFYEIGSYQGIREAETFLLSKRERL